MLYVTSISVVTFLLSADFVDAFFRLSVRTNQYTIIYSSSAFCVDNWICCFRPEVDNWDHKIELQGHGLGMTVSPGNR